MGGVRGVSSLAFVAQHDGAAYPCCSLGALLGPGFGSVEPADKRVKR